MPQPDKFLGIGSGSHAEQTAKVMIAMEQLLAEEKPDLVMVAGDVTPRLQRRSLQQRAIRSLAISNQAFAPSIVRCRKRSIESWLMNFRGSAL